MTQIAIICDLRHSLLSLAVQWPIHGPKAYWCTLRLMAKQGVKSQFSTEKRGVKSYFMPAIFDYNLNQLIPDRNWNHFLASKWLYSLSQDGKKWTPVFYYKSNAFFNLFFTFFGRKNGQNCVLSINLSFSCQLK